MMSRLAAALSSLVARAWDVLVLLAAVATCLSAFDVHRALGLLAVGVWLLIVWFLFERVEDA